MTTDMMQKRFYKIYTQLQLHWISPNCFPKWWCQLILNLQCIKFPIYSWHPDEQLELSKLLHF